MHKRTPTVIALTVALVAPLALSTLATARTVTDTAPLGISAPVAGTTLLAENEEGEGRISRWFRRVFHREDDDCDNDHGNRYGHDDDSANGGCGPAQPVQPAGTVAPPANGLLVPGGTLHVNSN